MGVQLSTGRPRLKRAAVGGFRALERLNLHVLPAHFYSPVTDRRWLRANRESWQRRLALSGIEWDLDAQIGWLERTCTPYLDEVEGFPFLPRIAERDIEFRYGLIEAQVLHCAIRSLAPGLVVEVGSGASTALMSDALLRNAADGRREGRVVTVDPHAPEQVSALPAVEVIRAPAQLVPDAVFEALRPGDLLFIDSTHVTKAGSELPRLYLEVVPRLPAGVFVHIHDIYLPYGYSPWLMSDLWDWQESVLVAALLTHNPRIEILCCQSALHHDEPDRLRAVLPDYRPRRLDDGIDHDQAGEHFPSSTWLRTR